MDGENSCKQRTLGSPRDSFGCRSCFSPNPSGEIRLSIPQDELQLDNGRVMSAESLKSSLARQRKAVRIDEFCRVIFPLGFIIFNVCYWNYYQSDFEDDEA